MVPELIKVKALQLEEIHVTALAHEIAFFPSDCKLGKAELKAISSIALCLYFGLCRDRLTKSAVIMELDKLYSYESEKKKDPKSDVHEGKLSEFCADYRGFRPHCSHSASGKLHLLNSFYFLVF